MIPLDIGGETFEIDMTDLDAIDYDGLYAAIRAFTGIAIDASVGVRSSREKSGVAGFQPAVRQAGSLPSPESLNSTTLIK